MTKTVDESSGFQRMAIGFIAAGAIAISVLGFRDMAFGTVSDGAATPDAVHGAADAVGIQTAAAGALRGGLAKPLRVLSVSSTGKLSDLFREVGYELDGVREGGEVPRLLLSALPKDLAKLPQPSRRKVMFIKSTLPLILHANEQVLHQRARIQKLRETVAHSGELHPQDEVWLDGIAEYYRVEPLDFEALLDRVDIVPPSLAIAQAAEESGWGTSRFAREGNALFGQRIYRAGADGLVPEGRGEDEQFRVRAFDHLLDGVRAYVHNLNTHFAYEKFRELRVELRAEERVIDGDALVGTLKRYSERGEAYIETIRTIIRANRLQVFDNAWLRETVIESEGGASPDA